ncbi:MAG: 3'-5' exonuclease [Pseudomonadota bacterium]
MLTALGLRLRIFLFFAFLALGGTALAGLGLWLGWSRAEGVVPTGPFVQALVLFAFLNTGLVLGIWLLFDENVAKPIVRLSTGLRLRAHSGVAADLSADDAKYLGDLAPAANALADTEVERSAGDLSRDAARLQAETERLTALLTEVPVATILVSERQRIVLYDGQASGILAGIAAPRFGAPIIDYFDADDLVKIKARMASEGGIIPFALRSRDKAQTFSARAKPLDNAGYMLMLDLPEQTLTQTEARPLVYDFDLLQAGSIGEVSGTPLSELCFVAFDSETTGLSTKTDEVVQIGAVRVLNGRVIEGETLDHYVDPGRPIPPASTLIHGVRDVDVVGAPQFSEVCRALHAFCAGAVLVAHNAPFDIAFLRREEGRARLKWDHPVLDTVLLSAVVFGTTEDHSLDALCARLHIDVPESWRHTALGDARVTAEALVRLIPLLEGRGLRTFADLLTETRKHSRLLQDLN